MSRRSRKGAWIEMPTVDSLTPNMLGRSRKGAWIEIKEEGVTSGSRNVAPARERGLKCLHTR